MDCKHVTKHLDHHDEAQEQIAFADVIILNKTDLVSEGNLQELEGRIVQDESCCQAITCSKLQY